ncbi:hypothetical protein HPB50_007212 [Hyalomma asiaticum]|uniref:Uncharacterized protein n=1 Tax=Hyalomma asiaticum TaxID=266040 RepID=A0ACB7SP09_HYAAI|nr:hypothetical protein HPB50_007212 [Hyalomma asiaticum]
MSAPQVEQKRRARQLGRKAVVSSRRRRTPSPQRNTEDSSRVFPVRETSLLTHRMRRSRPSPRRKAEEPRAQPRGPNVRLTSPWRLTPSGQRTVKGKPRSLLFGETTPPVAPLLRKTSLPRPKAKKIPQGRTPGSNARRRSPALHRTPSPRRNGGRKPRLFPLDQAARQATPIRRETSPRSKAEKVRAVTIVSTAQPASLIRRASPRPKAEVKPGLSSNCPTKEGNSLSTEPRRPNPVEERSRGQTEQSQIRVCSDLQRAHEKHPGLDAASKTSSGVTLSAKSKAEEHMKLVQMVKKKKPEYTEQEIRLRLDNLRRSHGGSQAGTKTGSGHSQGTLWTGAGLLPAATVSQASKPTPPPDYDPGTSLHKVPPGATAQDASRSRTTRKIGRSKSVSGLHEAQKRPPASDSGATGVEKTVDSLQPPTGAQEREDENGGAETVQGMGLTKTKIRRSQVGADAVEQVRVATGSDNMAPAGTTAPKQDTIAPPDEHRVAIAQEFDMCPITEALEDPEVTGGGGLTKCMTTRSRGRLESVLEGWSSALTHGNKEARFVILALGALVFVVILAAVTILLTRQGLSIQEEKLCHTRDCLAHASLLLHAVNMSIDPCEDLYGHVCSRWVPDRMYRDHVMSTLDEVRFAWYRQFNTTLDRGTLMLPVGRKVRAMYDSCMASEPQYGESVTAFMGLLHQYGLRWPAASESNVTALGVLIALDVDLRAAFWFTVREHKLISSRVVLISPSPFIATFLKHHLSVKASGNYIHYWKHFESVIYNNSRPPTSDDEIKRTADMEADILTRLYSAYNAQPKSALQFPLGEIERYTQPLTSAQWIEALNAKIELDRALSSSDRVITDDLRYLQAIGGIFANYSNEQILRHLAWHVIQQYATVTSYRLLNARLRKLREVRGVPSHLLCQRR